MYTTRGTIRIKTPTNELMPFYPKTNSSYIKADDTHTLKDLIDAKVANLENLGADERSFVEIYHIEPTEENTDDYSDNTLFLWYKSDEYAGIKHMVCRVSNDAENRTLAVGDTVTFTYTLTNDGGE